MIKKTLFTFFLFAASSSFIHSQTETLTNADIIEMSRSGLSKNVILKKVSTSNKNFDLSTKSLVEMKTAGVNDEVIAFMMDTGNAVSTGSGSGRGISGSAVTGNTSSISPPTHSRPQSISFEKSSLHPSRQALEKELLKRKDFLDLNLTILRYKEQADLYAEIGFVSGSALTHRYVYRIYDRRTGAVIAAGETTSWGSLAENLARHIAKRLNVALSK